MLVLKLNQLMEKPKNKAIITIFSIVMAFAGQFFLYRFYRGYEHIANNLDLGIFSFLNPYSLIIGVILYLFSVIGIILVFKNLDEPLEDLLPDNLTKPSRRAWLFIGSSLVLLLILLIVLIFNHNPVFLLLWLASFILGALGIISLQATVPDFSIFKLNKGEIVFLMALTAFYLITRIPLLDLLPLFVETDEGNVGLIAREYFTNYDFNYWHNLSGSLPSISFLPGFLGLSIWSNNLYGLRISSVIIGLLALLIFYFGVRTAFKKDIAAITSIIFASAQIFIGFSRTGYNNIQSIFIFVTVFSLLMFFYKTKNIIYSYLAGVVSAFGIYLYLGSRALILIASVFFLIHLIMNIKNWKIYIKPVLVFILGGLIIASPYLLFNLMHCYDASSRTQEVFYLTGQDAYLHMTNIFNTNNKVLIFLYSLFNALICFTYLPCQTSTSNFFCRPFLDFVSSPFFIVGVSILVLRIKNYRYLFMGTALSIIVLVIALAADSPTIHRVILVSPLLSLICAIAVYQVAKVVTDAINSEFKKKMVLKGIISFVLILIVLSNFETYFYKYIILHANFSMLEKKTMVAKIIEKYQQRFNIYFVYDDFSNDFERNSSLINTIEPSVTFIINNYQYSKTINLKTTPLSQFKFPNNNKDCIFLVDSTTVKPLNTVLNFFNNHKTLIVKNIDQPLFVIIKVSNQEIKQLKKKTLSIN